MTGSGRAPAALPPALRLELADAAVVAALLLVLAAAPLAIAAVEPWAWAPALAALAAAALGRAAFGGPGAPWPAAPFVVALGGLALLLGLQLAPWPPGLLGLASPRAAELAVTQGGGGWAPPSVAPPATFEALQKLALCGLGFTLGAVLGAVPRRARWLLLLLAALGTFESLYGLAEQLAGNATIFGVRKPIGGERTSGTFVNPNHFAGFLAVAIPAALGLAASSAPDPATLPRPWRLRLVAHLTHPSGPRRVLLAFLAVIMAVGLAGSQSRGGVVAALAGVAAVGVSVARLQRQGQRSWIVVVALSAVVLWLGLLGVEGLLARFGRLPEQETLTTAGRLAFTRDALAIALDFPLLGAGAGAFEAVYPRYQSVELPGIRLDHAHDDYAQALAELGIVGALGLALGLGWTVWQAWPRSDELRSGERGHVAVTALACLVPLALHSAVDFDLRLPAVALWASALLGVAWAVTNPERLRPLPPTRPTWGRVRLGAATLALGGLAGTALLAARADWVARPFVERAQGDPRPPRVRLESHERAVALWPFDPEAQVRLARLRFERALERRRREARAAAERVLDPARFPERDVVALTDELLAARLAADPTWPAEAAEALLAYEHAAQAVPGDPTWSQSAATLAELVPQLPRSGGAPDAAGQAGVAPGEGDR